MASKFSLSFTKTIEKKQLEPSAIRNDLPKKQLTILENIESVEDNVIKTDFKEEENELVIPLITEDRSNVLKRLKQRNVKNNLDSSSTDVKNLTLEELAAAEIVKESKEFNASRVYSNAESTLAIKTDNENLSSKSLGKLASNDDYEDIPIDSFGSAMLRGMGWKTSGGIGKHDKDIVPVDPFSKSRILGETKETKKVSKDVEQVEDQLELKVGSYVYIHNGRRKGKHGKVQFLDPEYIIIKLAMGRGEVTEVERNIKVVSQKEYQNSSRVINKHSYDSYKAKQECMKTTPKEENEHDDLTDSMSNSFNKSDDLLLKKLSDLKNKKKLKQEDNSAKLEVNMDSRLKTEKCTTSSNNLNYSKDEDRTRYINKDKGTKYLSKKDEQFSKCRIPNEKHQLHDDESERKHKKHKTNKSDSYYKDNLKKYKDKSSKIDILPCIPWIQENLRVRIISKSYKGGKYYKEKVCVKEIITPEECECLTYDNKLLTNIDPKWLETVIPKEKPRRIMVVKGEYKLQRGNIIEVNRDGDKAMVQLLNNSNIVKLHFDDICEFIT